MDAMDQMVQRVFLHRYAIKGLGKANVLAETVHQSLEHEFAEELTDGRSIFVSLDMDNRHIEIDFVDEKDPDGEFVRTVCEFSFFFTESEYAEYQRYNQKSPEERLLLPISNKAGIFGDNIG